MMRPALSIPVLVWASLAGQVLVGGCGSPRGATQAVASAEELLGLSLRFEPGEEFVPNPALAQRLGSEAVWDGTGDMLSDRITLTEQPKDGSVSPQLWAYAAEVEEIITKTFPDRKPIALDLDTTALGFEKLHHASVPWTSVAFTRDTDSDPSNPGVICDNAGIIMDFGDRYWTLSWNASRGELAQTKNTMARFMDALTLEPSS